MIGLVYFLSGVGAIMVVVMLAVLLERIYKARGGRNGWSRYTDAEIRRDVALEARRNARIREDIRFMFAARERGVDNQRE